MSLWRGHSKVTPPHDSLVVSFTFDSSKNVGYVKHAIRLYGNILPRGMATLVFDVNVVPPSDVERYFVCTNFCIGNYLLITSLRHTVGDIPSCDANTLEK